MGHIALPRLNAYTKPFQSNEIAMLKLAALDEDDLKVVSAHVQDSVIRVGDIRWDKAARRVLLEMNRFAWEHPTRSIFNQRYERRRSVLHFEGVRSV